VSSSLDIFVLEDNPADVMMIREALAEHEIQCEVEVASDVDIAETMLAKAEAARQQFDVFLIDLNLPKRPGQELLKALRRSRWWAQALVVIVTSSDSRQDREEARRLGANRYFKKPIRAKEYYELGAVVKELCQERGLAV
jgi:DNA-binding response OmpR family regulator